MSLLSRVLGVESTSMSAIPERKTVDASALTWTEILGTGGASKTGAAVNLASVLRIATAWACCRVVSEDIGKIPIHLLQRQEKRKRVAREHTVARILAEPNEWQTSQEFRQTLTLHASLTHGGYAWINRAKNGVILELVPLLNVTPKQLRGNVLVFEVRDAQGTIATLRQEEVFRIQGLSWNGYTGLELIAQGREAFGLTIAAEETQSRLHSNGARPGGVITGPNPLTDDQVDRIRDQFAGKYEGLANAFKTLLLDNGLEFKPWMMTGVDAQHLETRRFQIEEVCRFFRVFPAMIGHSDKAATFASAESFFRAHVGHTLQPWIVRWEQAIARDLLLPGERRNGYFAKLDPRGLLRGDDTARSAFYKSAVLDGWMTRNEVRDLEDLDPLDGLDEPLTPTNMTTDPSGAPAGAPAKGPSGDDEPADDDPEDDEP